jgi:hypothetical protein
MHQNPDVAVTSIIQTIEKGRLEVSKKQRLALIFMSKKEFTHVKQTITQQTRPQVKVSFKQRLIDDLLVLNGETRKVVESLEISGRLDN